MGIFENSKRNTLISSIMMAIFLLCCSNQAQAVQDKAATKIMGYEPSIVMTFARSYSGPYETKSFESDYIYTLADGEALITKYIGTNERTTILSTLGGATVTSVGERAFEDSTNLVGITIPPGIIRIGDRAFVNCTDLRDITFQSATTEIFDSSDTIPAITKIIGHTPSTAKTYAATYDRDFEDIGAKNTSRSILLVIGLMILVANVFIWRRVLA